MFLINSRSASFVATSRTGEAGHLANLRPAILPSSLRIVLSIACVYSTRPPVLVYSTDSTCFPYGSFPENRNSFLLIAFVTRINLTYEHSQIALRIHHKLHPITQIQRRICLYPDFLLLRPGYTWRKFSHSVHP